jgi:hypothetical protein
MATPMANELTSALNAALVKILRKLAHLVLSQGLTYEHFATIAKRVFIEVAESEFPVEGRKMTTTRVATMTGIPRKEVGRLRRLLLDSDQDVGEQRNRAAWVLTAWLRDERFLDAKNDPRELAFDGPGSFSELVRSYAGDVTPRAISDELQRNGALELGDDGKLRLNARSYTPQTGSKELLEIFGTDTADLMDTIIYNVMRSPDAPRLYQQKVMYDNVPVEYLDAFRKLSGRMSQHLLEEMDRWLADHDRGSNPRVLGTGKAKVGLMIAQIQSIESPGEVPNND